jgi:DNA-binding transcriptional regulator YiaG
MRKHYRPTAHEVRELRLHSGLTQRAVADTLAISVKTYQAYEQNRVTMPAPVWGLMCLTVAECGRGYPEDWYSN